MLPYRTCFIPIFSNFSHFGQLWIVHLDFKVTADAQTMEKGGGKKTFSLLSIIPCKKLCKGKKLEMRIIIIIWLGAYLDCSMQRLHSHNSKLSPSRRNGWHTIINNGEKVRYNSHLKQHYGRHQVKTGGRNNSPRSLKFTTVVSGGWRCWCSMADDSLWFQFNHNESTHSANHWLHSFIVFFFFSSSVVVSGRRRWNELPWIFSTKYIMGIGVMVSSWNRTRQTVADTLGHRHNLTRTHTHTPGEKYPLNSILITAAYSRTPNAVVHTAIAIFRVCSSPNGTTRQHRVFVSLLVRYSWCCWWCWWLRMYACGPSNKVNFYVGAEGTNTSFVRIHCTHFAHIVYKYSRTTKSGGAIERARHTSCSANE